jgi:hypothetical protein
MTPYEHTVFFAINGMPDMNICLDILWHDTCRLPQVYRNNTKTNKVIKKRIFELARQIDIYI